jgi:hypothetical protein
MTAQIFLSRKDIADRLGVQSGALSRLRLPPPDAVIGTVRGWTVESIDAWNAARPGRGKWRDIPQQNHPRV